MKIDGRCHCGEITFEADVDPTALGICHCTDCQMLSGSAFRTTFSAGRFRAPDRCAEELRQDDREREQAPARLLWNLRNADFACAPVPPQSYSLRVGTIAQRAALSPRRQSWRRSALVWVDRLATVPGSEKG